MHTTVGHILIRTMPKDVLILNQHISTERAQNEIIYANEGRCWHSLSLSLPPPSPTLPLLLLLSLSLPAPSLSFSLPSSLSLLPSLFLPISSFCKTCPYMDVSHTRAMRLLYHHIYSHTHTHRVHSTNSCRREQLQTVRAHYLCSMEPANNTATQILHTLNSQ